MPVLPVVSIVGRPNVGKSCIFNRILGQRVAVVDDYSGLTRDRNYRNTVWNKCAFTLTDTGGLLPGAKDAMAQDIEKQVAIACEESDAILFIVDAKTGITTTDTDIARRLRKQGHGKVFLAINKSEYGNSSYDRGTFMSLGFGEGYAISALHGSGMGDLLDDVCKQLKKTAGKQTKPNNKPDDSGALKIAILGRPNAGKSSLVNKLLGQERMIVRPEAGTTRDSIDSLLYYHDKPILLIDTAGLRKKASVKKDMEYYCNLRALASIERCDVAVLLIDASEGINEQDMKIVRQINDRKKGLMICYNKWDLVPKTDTTFDQLAKLTKKRYMEFAHTPVLSTSAKTGQRITTVIDRAVEIHQRMSTRIDDFALWDIMREWVTVHPHPVSKNKRVTISGCRQANSLYPLFLIYATNPKSAIPSYKRFLANKIHDTYDFSGCPLIVEFVPPRRVISTGSGQGDPSVFLKGDDVP